MYVAGFFFAARYWFAGVYIYLPFLPFSLTLI